MREFQDFIGRTLVAAALWSWLVTGAPAADDLSPEPDVAKPGNRLVLFAPFGPVRINAVINTGDQSLDQIRQEYANDLFTRLDADKSGKLESAEQANIPFVQRGGQPASPEMLQQFLVDGSLTPESLANYVNAQLGPLFTVVVKPPRADQTVRLVDVLDRDRDSIVSLDEVVRSETALRRFDLDDDESLSVLELQPFPQSIVQAQRQEIATNRDAPVVELATDDSRAKTIDRILSKFANGGDAVPLAVCGLGQSASPFDTDSDDKLSRLELAKWLAESPPDVTLTVRFPGNGLPPSVEAELPQSDRVKPPEKAVRRRWHAILDGMDVQADAADKRFFSADSFRLARTRFQTSDNDNNDYLNEQEYGGLQFNAPFSAIDVNGDAMLRIEEIEAYAKTQARLSMTSMVLTISDDVTSLYQLMDADSNRRLTPREMASLGERLAPQDRNGDGRFDPSDFVSKYKLSFAFSVPPGFDQVTPVQQMPMGRTGRPPRARVGPLWFQKMDRNRDIDVSWREFLGPRATFEKIDANHDGLIDKDEAEAASTGAGTEVVGER